MIYLETERLLLRDHLKADLETHHALYSDPVAMFWLKGIKTGSLAESRKNLELSILQSEDLERDQYFLRVVLKESGEHIGEIGYTVTDRTPFGQLVNLGYFSYQKHWNHGYMTEAAKALIRYAFTKDGVYRISASCVRENPASEAVMKKCGMIKEGEYIKAVFQGGRMRDRLTYRLLKEEYEMKTGETHN